ncbi:endonuclease [Chitinophaga caeni]|uniref:Endonuclease n=1 Tax=Chitinophaga caeni TaxID=2029983 RepID=A0A291QPX3_9BACT|nr:DNA/RNA non-specific endonuclease [Chitinophaga caeni]ATL46049.1 endonuclease [Chitinophaga caeni]
MPTTRKKKKKGNKSKQKNKFTVWLILIAAAFIVSTCSRQLTNIKEYLPTTITGNDPRPDEQVAPETSDERHLLLESFEYSAKPAYNRELLELPTGPWLFKDAMIGDLKMDHKDGKQAARLRNNGFIRMEYDLQPEAAIHVSILHARFGNDAASTWQLWYSTDRGATYKQAGNTIRSNAIQLQRAHFNIPKASALRLEIRKSGSDNNRVNIDAIAISYRDRRVVNKPSRADHKKSELDDDHLLLGNPSHASTDISFPDNYLLDKKFFKLSYNKAKGTPNWVSWHLDKNDMGKASRQKDFNQDGSLPPGWYQVSHSSYSGSGFDRGHNCPSADRTSSREANNATFYMTNMLPQAPNHNQHLWANLEEYTRGLVKRGNEVYIIMGSYGIGGIGNRGKIEKIDKKRITVPSHIWKIIVVIPYGNNDLARINKNTRVIAVNTPNSNTADHNWRKYITSVAEIEAATHYHFFTSLPDSTREILIYKTDQGR